MNNSGLDRINNSKFDRGRGTAQRSAKAQLWFILKDCSLLDPKYPEVLDKTRSGKKKLSDAKDMDSRNEPFTEKQMGYIDGIYEWVNKEMELGGYTRKHDYGVRKVGNY